MAISFKKFQVYYFYELGVMAPMKVDSKISSKLLFFKIDIFKLLLKLEIIVPYKLHYFEYIGLFAKPYYSSYSFLGELSIIFHYIPYLWNIYLNNPRYSLYIFTVICILKFATRQDHLVIREVSWAFFLPCFWTIYLYIAFRIAVH